MKARIIGVLAVVGALVIGVAGPASAGMGAWTAASSGYWTWSTSAGAMEHGQSNSGVGLAYSRQKDYTIKIQAKYVQAGVSYEGAIRTGADYISVSYDRVSQHRPGV
jgi:hypothetical protein